MERKFYGETWFGVGLGKDATTTILKAAPAERAISKEIASSIFTAEFWTVFRKCPRLTLRLISPTSLIKDVGKGLIKGSAVGIPQLLFNNWIDEKEKELKDKNEEIENAIMQHLNSDIIAKKV